jgi:hypothetical protein
MIKVICTDLLVVKRDPKANFKNFNFVFEDSRFISFKVRNAMTISNTSPQPATSLRLIEGLINDHTIITRALIDNIQVNYTNFNSYTNVKFDFYKKLFSEPITYTTLFNLSKKYLPLFLSGSILVSDKMVLESQIFEFNEAGLLTVILGSAILSKVYSNSAKTFTAGERTEFEENCKFLIVVLNEMSNSSTGSITTMYENYRHLFSGSYAYEYETEFLLNLENNNDTSLLLGLFLNMDKPMDRICDTEKCDTYTTNVISHIDANRNLPYLAFDFTKIFNNTNLQNYFDCDFEKSYFKLSPDSDTKVDDLTEVIKLIGTLYPDREVNPFLFELI